MVGNEDFFDEVVKRLGTMAPQKIRAFKWLIPMEFENLMSISKHDLQLSYVYCHIYQGQCMI